MADYDKYLSAAGKAGEAEGRAAGRAKGAAKGSAIGTGTGAVVGGALGSVIPGAGTVVGASIGATIGGAIGGLFGGKSGAKKGARKAKIQARKKAADQFQKDWKAKKRKQVASERAARANIEEANLQASAVSKLSDDALLQQTLDRPSTLSARGSTQLDKFEQTYFG